MSYGLADYVDFFPCPYDQVVDAFDSIPPSAIPQPIHDGCDCGCGGGCGGMSGLTMDGTGLLGTGLFAGGMDLSTWGAGEMAVLALGAFALYSMMSTTRRGAARVSAGARRTRKRMQTYSAGVGGHR